MRNRPGSGTQNGMALLAVLFALVLLMLLTLTFSVSMTVGANVAQRDVEETSVQQASASVRDLLIVDAAMSHPALDPTPGFDGLDEWPGEVVLPKAFEGLADDGRVLLGGRVVDLQRFLHLDSASPLLLANVIGTTTRLREDLTKESKTIEVDDATNLPESGWVWINGELIQYGAKGPTSLEQLARGQLQPEFADGTQQVRRTALVLDYRCVVAAAWPTFGDDATRQKRQPYRSVSELLAIDKLGFGAFTAAEMDALQRAFAVDTMAATAATWGRPERVFNDLVAGQSNVITVKCAAHLGAGSTVRITNTKTGAVEYGLVMATATDNGSPDIQFRPVFQLGLLFHVLQSFPRDDTVVEPLIPAPVNVNTAAPEVLAALCAHVRPGADVRVHEGDGANRLLPNWISPSQARELADDLATQRAPGGAKGPIAGWQDFVERIWKPRLEQLAGNADAMVWLALYRNAQTGRDSVVEMGTAPLCFQSGPWVAYRAAASRSRSAAAPGVAARHERTGVAAAMPGFTVERAWSTQEQFEDAFLLDRRSQFWTTFPTNLGALVPGARGLDPAARYYANLLPVAFPNAGFGEPRFPATDAADSGISPAPSTAPSSDWGGNQRSVHGVETFSHTTDIRGHDVKKLGPYLMQNTGPASIGVRGYSAPPQTRHDRISFPFSNPDSFTERFAVGFWAHPQSLGNCILFEHGVGDPDRNRLVVEVKDGVFAWRVFDEAGRDPNPSASPAGVPDNASEWTVPVAELALPPDTPLHVAVSATSGRPADLSFALDGMTRGKPKYVTYLTAALPVFDPTLANNSARPGTSNNNERFLDVRVESTEGFPPVGVLRIGTELYEYSSLQGNAFRCQWKDSLGGRGARQLGREFRPSIPTKNGVPVVDINDPQFQNANLDFFPAHAAGTLVELYGYSAVLSEDTPMMPGKTTLAGSLGAFTVARAFVDNPRPITVTAGSFSFTIGSGLDETMVTDIKLADPLPGKNPPPPAASDEIANGFPTGGGYALLVQRRRQFEVGIGPGQLTTTESIGGVELIKYSARQGSKLTGVQRAQTIPGDTSQIDRQYSDGTARKFVTEWNPGLTVGQPPITYNEIPTLILWVVPVSITVQNAQSLLNPQSDPAGLVQWLQCWSKDRPNDTEWVRYDAIVENRFVVRGNRAAWERLRWTLTRQVAAERVQVNQNGPTGPTTAVEAPWGTVTETSGYIGYTPKLEAQYPQIQAARYALRFRGDPMADVYGDGNQARSDPNAQSTSSHPQNNSMVTQCHRLQLLWGTFGVFTGRLGRNDRVALVQGSIASGSDRPNVEWHTVNWAARRYEADRIPQQGQGRPPELLGPWPFQLVAFQDEVRVPMLGPPRGTQIVEPRRFDRVVKFPSGELPAARCEQPSVGSGYGNQQPMTGIVDEVEVVQHFAQDLVVDEAFDATAKQFTANRAFYLNSVQAVWAGGDLSAAYPEHGGLVQVDDEIIAYQSRTPGGEAETAFATFAIATNGRGLLNTEPRSHDRGARVKFLTHRPAAILAAAVTVRDHELPLQSRSALPENYGTVLLGRELLHYAWMRARGDQVLLGMPRWYQPDRRDDNSIARGLFRGRFGTAPQSASSGEPVIAFPFRYWDRHVDRSDDPELANFQITTSEAPVYYRSLRWRQETSDPRVEVLCMVRADSKLPWESEPLPAGGYWHFRTPTADGAPHKLGHQASRLEIRFATVYKPGVVDLATFGAHAWKTTARVEDVRLEYEGEGRVFDERVTAR